MNLSTPCHLRHASLPLFRLRHSFIAYHPSSQSATTTVIHVPPPLLSSTHHQPAVLRAQPLLLSSAPPCCCCPLHGPTTAVLHMPPPSVVGRCWSSWSPVGGHRDRQWSVVIIIVAGVITAATTAPRSLWSVVSIVGCRHGQLLVWRVGAALYEHPSEIDMAIQRCQMQHSRPVLLPG